MKENAADEGACAAVKRAYITFAHLSIRYSVIIKFHFYKNSVIKSLQYCVLDGCVTGR